MKGLTEVIYVGLSVLYHHYRSMQGNRVIYGMQWMSAGNDGMVKMVSLYSISSYILSSYFRTGRDRMRL